MNRRRADNNRQDLIFYRNILDNVSDMIQCVDAQAKCIYVNNCWKEKLGYTEQEVESLTLWDIIPEEEKEHCLLVFSRICDGEREGLIKSKFLCKDGSKIPVEGNASAETDSQGNFLHTCGVFRDISNYDFSTERNLFEERLRESEEKYRLLVSQVPGAIFQCRDDEQRTIVYISEGIEQLTGYTQEEFLRREMSPRKVILPEDYPYVMEVIKKKLAKRESYELEYRILHADGSERWLSENGRGVFSEGEKLLFISGVLLDITKQKMIEQAVQKSEERYRYLLENLNEIIYALDTETKIRYISPNIETISGYSPGELFGKSYMELVYSGDREEREDAFTKALHGEGAVSEFRLMHKNGSALWFRTDAKPIYQDGVVVGIQGVLSDITAKKFAEKALQENNELLQTITNNMFDVVALTDLHGKIQYITDSISKLGYSPTELIKGNVLDNVHSEDLPRIILEFERFVQEKDNDYRVETRFYKKDRSYIWFEIIGNYIMGQEEKGDRLVFSARDVTERIEKQQEIEFLSYHDHLTGLYNRRFFEEEIVRLDRRRNLPLSLIIIDVNGLKLINDSFGHEKGDDLLRAAANILRNSCRSDEIISRTGGDEFAILLPETDEAGAAIILDRIAEEAEETSLDSLIVSLALGAATKKDPEQDFADIKFLAENAMYKNKLKTSRRMRRRTVKNIMDNLNASYIHEQEHSAGVMKYSELLGEVVGLSEKELKALRKTAYLHDIGKIMVPAELLMKKAKLTQEEYKTVRKHAEIGYQILKSIDECFALAEYVLHHHEWWNGQGFPEGLAEEEIPLFSRIISIADAYEAMTSPRPYRKQKTREEALRELRDYAGIQFDPHLVESFIEELESDKWKMINLF